MPSNWTTTTLASVIQLLSGGTPSTSEPLYWNGAIPWLSVADFNTGLRHVSRAEKTITDLGLTKSATSLLRSGDSIISARGTVGVIAQVSSPMAFNQSCYGIRSRENVHPDFLYYLLKTLPGQFKALSHGAVFSTITRNTFELINVQMPPLPEQQAIAALLSSIDNRIENLQKTNSTLEAIAQTLFKSWFIDFDPVKANNQQASTLPDHISSLFPSEFEESELGLIPKGWSVSNCLNVLTFTKGTEPGTTNYKTAPATDLSPFLRVGDLSKQKSALFVNTLTYAKALVTPQDILISLDGTVGLVQRGLAGVISAGIRKVCDIHNQPSPFAFFTLKSPTFQEQLERYTPAFTTLPHAGSALKHIQLISPPPDLVAQFNSITQPLQNLILNNLQEQQKLSALRDTLLPQLISGSLRLPSFADPLNPPETPNPHNPLP